VLPRKLILGFVLFQTGITNCYLGKNKLFAFPFKNLHKTPELFGGEKEAEFIL
jgi:hypothetical protein